MAAIVVAVAVAVPAGAAGTARSAAAKGAVTRSYDGFLRAVAAGHGRSACARMTPSGRAELMGAAGLWLPWRGTCAEAAVALRGVIRRQPALRDVRIFGMRASARLGPGDYRFFVRAGRRWKVAGTASTNVLAPPILRPHHAAAPSRFLGVDWKRVQGWGDDAATWAADASRWQWFAPALAAALVALCLALALRGRRLRRHVVALERSLEDLTARAHRALSASMASASPSPGDPSSVRDDLATLMRVNKELTARLDAVQSRSEGVTRRLLDELARTDADHDEVGRLKERLARSETARTEAQIEIEALHEHVRHLRERAQLPD